MGIQAKNKEEKYAKILNVKKEISTEKLLKNGPQELIAYLNYCKGMAYEQEPDYHYLTQLFKDLILKTLNDSIDYRYDWVTKSQALNHIKIMGITIENDNYNSNIVTTSDEMPNNKNEILDIEKDNIIKTTENERINHYDDVIDEINIMKKERENKNDDVNKNDNEDKKEKKHGQCCLIV